MYKSILLCILIIGIIFLSSSVALDIAKKRYDEQSQKTNIVYKYVPRTLEEEEEQPAYVSDIFNAMFTQPSTWIKGVNDLDTRKREAVNQYFASQN